MARSGRHLRWNKSHWPFVDRSLLLNFLLVHGIDSVTATALVETTFALSAMHIGTVVLIPDDWNNLPRVAGHIDASPLATALVSSLAGRPLPDLLADNSILGVLGSDGLTMLQQDGVVVASGQIIDLRAESPSDAFGGGRTQAALAASRHGIVIKVSQDGPLSLFYNGCEVLRYNI